MEDRGGGQTDRQTKERKVEQETPGREKVQKESNRETDTAQDN